MASTSYRPDIDGLRAFAVFPVVIYHAYSSLAPGGYIGVDVFFVVSGYLITRIIFAEIQEKRFSLAHFYERRARRILPALFAVMFACTIVGALILASEVGFVVEKKTNPLGGVIPGVKPGIDVGLNGSACTKITSGVKPLNVNSPFSSVNTFCCSAVISTKLNICIPWM